MLGPRGSGRSTAVRAATAALGIHLLPLSCHDLKGQTDGQTATALKAALEAAQEFCPVVLLLRHFEVLAESPSGASQGTACVSPMQVHLQLSSFTLFNMVQQLIIIRVDVGCNAFIFVLSGLLRSCGQFACQSDLHACQDVCVSAKRPCPQANSQQRSVHGSLMLQPCNNGRLNSRL